MFFAGVAKPVLYLSGDLHSIYSWNVLIIIGSRKFSGYLSYGVRVNSVKDEPVTSGKKSGIHVI